MQLMSASYAPNYTTYELVTYHTFHAVFVMCLLFLIVKVLIVVAFLFL